MFNFIYNIFEPKFGYRSSKWKNVRDEHLLIEPCCQICGGIKKLSVHHIVPYHIDRSKELDMDNLITLCEYRRCHFTFGHLFNWEKYNPDIRKDVAIWKERLKPIL